MQVANPKDVPEYEVKPQELLRSTKKDSKLPEVLPKLSRLTVRI